LPDLPWAFPPDYLTSVPSPTSPIKHFVTVTQTGHTFDNYFGTYPGADGLGAGTCQPLSVSGPAGPCVKPFLLDNSERAPLGANATIIASQWNGGKMNGFVAAYQQQGRDGAMAMGHYNAAQLPFYWEAAQNYVLFDHFFSSAQYGIRNNRSYWVSASPAPGGTGRIPAGGYGNLQTIFDRLQAAHVSWKFYVQGYNRAQTYKSVSPDSSETQTARVPLVDFRRFTHDPSLASHIVGLDQYYRDLRAGTLPAVAYVASSSGDDERSAQSVSAGQSMVGTMTTQLMESRYWDNSAFMWSYDGSGGWYDGVRPPTVAGQPLGYRVPALLVSAYARKGLVSHTVLDYTSALRFIEQNWTLAPLTARDAHAKSLLGAFDFGQGLSDIPIPPEINFTYSFTLAGGSLPPGLALKTNGILSGTPTTATLDITRRIDMGVTSPFGIPSSSRPQDNVTARHNPASTRSTHPVANARAFSPPTVGGQPITGGRLS